MLDDPFQHSHSSTTSGESTVEAAAVNSAAPAPARSRGEQQGCALAVILLQLFNAGCRPARPCSAAAKGEPSIPPTAKASFPKAIAQQAPYSVLVE